MKRLLVPFTFLLLLVASCNNDLDVIDKYKETTIVYGLINAFDSSQYLRIEKAFLGEGNAYLMAQQSDSIYPDTSELVVTLQKVMNGNPVDSFIRFEPVTDVTKEEGLFTNYPHIVYRSVDELSTPYKDDYIDKRASYKLNIFNKRTGEAITASTPVVKDVILDPTSPLLYPSTNINLASANPFRTEATFPEFGRVMNLTVKFNYVEKTIGSTFFENKSLNFVMDDYVSSSDAGGQKFTYLLYGDDLFQFLRSHIKKDPSLFRPSNLVSLDFIFTIGATEFYTYYSIGNSSALLNDVIPSYTNLSSGLGILSSRSSKTFPDKHLTAESIDSLANGRYTKDIFD